MKKDKITIALMVVLMSFFMLSCSDKGDPVTPTPTVPDYVGSWTCTPSNASDAFSFTVSNISGKAWVTSYDLTVKFETATSAATSIQSATLSDGIVEVVNGVFTLTSINFFDVEASSVLNCQFSTESAGAGSYTMTWIPLGSSQSVTVTGTFTSVLN